MNLKQLEYALAVADTGSFTRAAERCHVVQSALSHQVARLEAQLGVSLFERSSRRVRLTHAGEAFVLSARPAVEAARRIADDVAAACGQVRGRLSIGEISSLTALDLVDLLAVFHRRHPDVDVRWLTAKSELLMADVCERRLDVGFVGLWQGEVLQGVQHRLLAREELVAVLPPCPGGPGAAGPGGPGRRGAGGLPRRHWRAPADRRSVPGGGGGASGAVRDRPYSPGGKVRPARHGRGAGAGADRPGFAGVAVVPLRDAPVRHLYAVWSPSPTPAARAFLVMGRAVRC
jgi:DNA-binding transcriptional LysR family regulator